MGVTRRCAARWNLPRHEGAPGIGEGCRAGGSGPAGAPGLPRGLLTCFLMVPGVTTSSPRCAGHAVPAARGRSAAWPGHVRDARAWQRRVAGRCGDFQRLPVSPAAASRRPRARWTWPRRWHARTVRCRSAAARHWGCPTTARARPLRADRAATGPGPGSRRLGIQPSFALTQFGRSSRSARERAFGAAAVAGCLTLLGLATLCPAAPSCCGRFHPHAHLRVTPSPGDRP